MSALTQLYQCLKLFLTRDPLIDCQALLDNRRGRDLSFFCARSLTTVRGCDCDPLQLDHAPEVRIDRAAPCIELRRIELRRCAN